MDTKLIQNLGLFSQYLLQSLAEPRHGTAPEANGTTMRMRPDVERFMQADPEAQLIYSRYREIEALPPGEQQTQGILALLNSIQEGFASGVFRFDTSQNGAVLTFQGEVLWKGSVSRPIYNAAFWGNGDTIALGSHDSGLYILSRIDEKTWEPQKRVGMDHRVNALTFAEDGVLLIAGGTGSDTGEISRLDPSQGIVWKRDTERFVISLALSKQGILAAGTNDGDLYFLDGRSGELLGTRKIPGRVAIEDLDFAQDGRLAIGTNRGRIYVFGKDWILDEKKEPLVQGPLKQYMVSAKFSKDEQQLLVGCDSGKLAKIDLNSIQGSFDSPTQNGILWLDFPGAIRSGVFSPNGDQAAAARTNGNLTVMNEHGKILFDKRLDEKEKNFVQFVAYLPQGHQLLACSQDGSIFLLR